MEQDPDSPPTFWFQPPLTTNRRRAPPIDPVVLIILLPILAMLFLYFFLPPFLSHTSHILKPGSVKSTWDSVNIFLVLFAILCGVLARRNDDSSSSGDVVDQPTSRNSVESAGQRFSDRKMVDTGGLRRSSSSYPDLRQESLWDNDDNRNRVLDDFHVDMYSSPVSRYYGHRSRLIERESLDLYRSTPRSVEIRHRRSKVDSGECSDVKEIVVDKFEVSPNVPDFREQTTATPPPPTPPPPPSAPSANSTTHSFQSVGRNVKAEIPTEIDSDELVKGISPRAPPPQPPTSPPPPPPQPPTEVKLQRLRHKHRKLERRVNNATKELATAITSLYTQRTRKHKRKLRNYYGSSDTSPPSLHSIQSPDLEEPRQSPVPPPPPPPPFMFYNLFKKESKHKKIHSVSATVSPTLHQPPLPPPPNSIFNNLFKSANKSKRFHSPSAAPPSPPPLPASSIMNGLFKNGTKSKRFNSITTASSPPPPAPPPPPPPMTPPRYTIPVKSKQLSKRKSQAHSPPTAEPHNHCPTSKGKPPLPTKASSYYDSEDFMPSGSQSPLIPMPPPPPPFRVPSMIFELRGDFVRIRSTHSSVCSSPDRDDNDLSSAAIDGGELTGSHYGPGPGPRYVSSPDINAKAESFISRLKGEWKMEKIHAVKDKMG